jgi:hypothetical protein
MFKKYKLMADNIKLKRRKVGRKVRNKKRKYDQKINIE